MKKKILTLALVAGLVLSSFTAAIAGSPVNGRGSDSSSSDSSSSSGGSTTVSVTNSGTTTTATVATVNADGQTVNKAEYESNGVNFTVTTVGTDGTTLQEADQNFNGTHVTIRSTAGGADVGPNGQAICKDTILVITENGQSVGCFVDPATGLAVATGKDEIYWAYDANGNLVQHYVNAAGLFYTGTHVINGVTYIFNSEGVIIG